MNGMKKSISSFLKGIGSIFDSCASAFSPQINIKFNSCKDDTEALKNDWKAIGADMKRNIENYDKQRGLYEEIEK